MEENLSTTSRKHPKKDLVGVLGNYCCVPGCEKSAFLLRQKKTLIYSYVLFLKEKM